MVTVVWCAEVFGETAVGSGCRVGRWLAEENQMRAKFPSLKFVILWAEKLTRARTVIGCTR
jgi:hypothetical protein